jgi:serine/threonine protein kinase
MSRIISQENKMNCYNKKYQDKVIPITRNTNNIENKNEIGNLNNEKDYYSNIDNMNSFLKTYKPKFFEDFELIEFINSGSVGHVYKGNVKISKKPIAIKFIMNDNRKDKKGKKEFFQEFEINRKLHNPHINEIYSLTRINNDSYFSIIEYGRYSDLNNLLKNLLKRKTLTETSLDYFGTQILKGLEHMHKCKVLHLDIKPGNILIDSNLNAKLTDFSVSCSYASFNPGDEARIPFAGTSKFMSPEILSRKNIKIRDCEKIDVYSFGVCLYYLFFGEFPYNLNQVKSKDYSEIMKTIEEKKLEFPKDVEASELLKDFFSKTLEKDITKRLNIRQALNHPWIKGSSIIFDEKENVCNLENFLIKLITDNIPKFNEYIKKK